MIPRAILAPISMTVAQARAFHARWKRVVRAEAAALRRSLMETRLRTLAALMASVPALDGLGRLATEDAAVRRRWARLRRVLRG